MGMNVRPNSRPREARLELWRSRFREFSSGTCAVDPYCKGVGVSSAHRQDLDVEMYLDDIIRSSLSGSTDYESILPDTWRKSHPSAIPIYRQEKRRDQADRSRFQAAKRRQLFRTP